MLTPYSFHKNIILRTPHFAFVNNITSNDLTRLLNSPVFTEALYLASPALYDECKKMQAGMVREEKDIAKIKASLIKYYLRMYSRCTPFGMFAGCSVIEWANQTQIEFAQNSIKRSTRLDMHFMCALAQHIAQLPPIKNRLLYKVNNSFYQLGNETRYVEYKYINGSRVHQISSVESSDYLSELLQASLNGITLLQAEEILLKYVDDREETAQLIEELLQSQLLVSELEPSITGEEFIVQVIQKLQRINDAGDIVIANLLNNLQAIVQAIQQP